MGMSTSFIPWLLYLQGKSHEYLYWVGSKIGMDSLEKREIYCCHQESKCISLDMQPVAWALCWHAVSFLNL